MDHCKVAVAGLKNIVRLFTQDLEALPDDAVFRNFGRKARSVADIVAEVNLVNDHVGLTVCEEPLFFGPKVGSRLRMIGRPKNKFWRRFELPAI